MGERLGPTDKLWSLVRHRVVGFMPDKPFTAIPASAVAENVIHKDPSRAFALQFKGTTWRHSI